MVFLELRLGSRILGPKESKAQLGELGICYSSSSFLMVLWKMADIDIDPPSDHNKPDDRTDESMGKNIPLTPGGGSTWEPEQEPEQETSFRGIDTFSLLKYHVEELYRVLSEYLEQDPMRSPFLQFRLKRDC